MEDNKKQNRLIWLIFGISITTLFVMSSVAYIGWGLLNKKINQQLLDTKDRQVIAKNYAGGLQDSPFGFHPALPYGEAEKIGVQWTRGGNFPYLFWSIVDSKETGDPKQFKWKGSTTGPNGQPATVNYDAIFDIQKTGLSVMLNIQPEPILGPYSKKDSWVPVNETAYRNFVKEAVKRYSFVKYWQVGNEPNMDPNGPTDFSELQRITYEAIKEANPEAQVIMGGVAGNMSLFDMNDDYFEPVLKKLNGKYVDIFDIHFYGDAMGGTSTTTKGRVLGYKDFKTVHDYYRNLLDKNGFKNVPIWSTEMGTFSGLWMPVGLKQTEVDQAKDLVRRHVYLLSMGVKKIFWAFGLIEGFNEWDNDFFDLTGLIYGGQDRVHSSEEKKLGYYSYKLMTEKLEGSDWSSIEKVQEKGGVYIYKFTKQGKPVWVAWNDNKQEKQIVISGFNSNQAVITDSVPKYESGKEVLSYGTSFNVETKTVELGKITLILKNKPVFVEEK